MSVNEIQVLAQRFADGFDKWDVKTVLEMLSDDVEVIDHVPYRFDSKATFAKYLKESIDHQLRLSSAVLPCVQRDRRHCERL